MKPELLRICGLGPFATEQQIDFTKADDFILITGETGAGKTSIFDGMTFALYGELAGTRDTNSIASHFLQTEDAVEPFAELVFSVGGERYKLRRTPTYDRLKKTGGGTTRQKTIARLFEFTNGEWLPVAKNTTEINQMIADKLHLTKEEFSKIVLLPQGEFQKFLVADTNDKQELLAKIFPAELYRQVMDAAKKKSKLKGDEIAAKKNQQQEIGASFNYDTSERDIATLQIEFEKADAILKAEEEALKQIAVELNKAQTLDAKFNELTAMKNDLQELEQKLNLFLNNGKYILQPKMNEKQTTLSAPDVEPLLSELQQEIGRLKSLQAKEDELNKMIPEGKILANIAEAKKSELTATEKKFIACKEAQAKLNEELQTAAKAAESRAALREQLEESKKLYESLKAFKQLNDKLTAMSQKLNDLQAHRLKAAKISEINSEEELRLQKQKDSSVAASLAVHLKEGAPCPVCGSISHPAPAEDSKAWTFEDKLTAAKENAESSKIKLAEIDADIRHTEEQIAELKKQTDEMRPPQSADIASCEKEVKELEEKNKTLYKLAERAKTLPQDIKKAEEEQAKLEQDVETLRAEAAIAEQKVTTKRELAAAIQKELNGLKNISKLVEEKENYKNELAAYLNRKMELNVKINANETELRDKQKPNLSKIEKKQAEAEARQREHKAARDAALQRKNTLAEKRRDYVRLTQEIDRLTEENAAIAKLADELNGKNKKNISFQNFMLGECLRQVALFANNRLKRISDGRYEFIVNDMTDDKRKQGGLDLDIFDSFTGIRRSAGTLSGGEKFLAAISLSFGLADAIQRVSASVDMDALFIDEGFGSLSSGALDNAIAVLDELRGSRMVGIISHVEELKQRIDYQIKVVKGQAGSRIIQNALTD